MSAQRRLAKARKTRHTIGTELGLVKAGHITVFEALEHPSDAIKRVKIFDLLRRTPKLGPEGAKKILMDVRIWPITRIHTLTLSQRRKILEALPARVRNFYSAT